MELIPAKSIGAPVRPPCNDGLHSLAERNVISVEAKLALLKFGCSKP